MWFLGVDIGTTHLKVVGVTDDGTVLEPIRSRTPVEHRGGLIFHHGEEVWRAVQDLVAGYAAGAAAPYGALGGMSVATFGQEEAFPVDAVGRPLAPSLAWWQSWPERTLTAGIVSTLASFEHYRISGMPYRDNQTPDRLARFRATSPELWRRTKHWVDFGADIGFRLTGVWRTSATQISHSQLVDVTSLEPATDALTLLDLDPGLLAEVGHVGSPVGPIRAGALPGVDVAVDAVLYLGGHDQVFAAYANSLYRDVDVLDSIGTAEYVMLLGEAPRLDERLWRLGVDVERGWRPGQYVMGWGLPSGKIMQQLAHLFLADDFDRLLAAVADEGPMPDVDFTVHDLREAGASLISIGRVPADARPEDLVRACVTQLSRRIGETLRLMADASGTSGAHVALTGSLFRRPELVAHRARAWGLPLVVSDLSEAVAVGAASLARAATTGRDIRRPRSEVHS